MLPSPTARTLFVIPLPPTLPLTTLPDPHDVSGARRFFRGKRRRERRHGVLGRADRRLDAFQGAIGEIREFFLESAATGALEHRPIGRIGAVELVLAGDAEVRKGVLDLD